MKNTKAFQPISWSKLALLASLAFVLFASCTKSANEKGGSAEGTSPQEKLVLKVSTKFVDSEQTAKSLKLVAQKVKEKSNGNIDLQVATGGILPIGKDGMEQVVSGAKWISVDGIGFIADYVPDFNAITGPLLYNSFDEYLAMTRSDLVKDLKDQAYEKGVKILSLDWVFGFRSILTTRFVKTPADLNGLKLRVPSNQIYTLTLSAMGANPTPMPYPEVYQAIQQGVIDGLEASNSTIYGTKIYEVVKKVSLTRHLLGVSAISISAKLWESLSDEQRQIIEEGFAEGTADNLKEATKAEEELRAELEKLGVEFQEVDKESFATVSETVIGQLEKLSPGIYDRITQELKRIRS